MKTHRTDIKPYITRDGSQIRELMHPAQHQASLGSRQQSLAEAIVAPHSETVLHRHHLTEELYHITQGHGIMVLAANEFDITVGDTVCIPPQTAHKIRNTGDQALHLLCCCTPAYDHDDTELLE